MAAPRFDTVLVANRGEIAVRVIRSVQAAGLRAVAVHSDADADAPHTRLADTAVRIGPARAHDSYLDIDRVIEAARTTGAGAIHPGYGFLAENADFAKACADAGIAFIGPSPDAIRVMGDKAVAKRRVAEVGVPLLPGYQGEDQDDDRLVREAEAIGLPLMVKAAAGGGGKGMRLVTSVDELPDALAAARREALGAFGSEVLILERALLEPRHVEVQVIADEHGTVLAVGDRDCSVQRRHQKVIEEAPAPDLDPATRTAMHDAAIAAARAVDYVGAGTVEFLLGTQGDSAGTFAFLEMNTRLQVEHPVTELVTGLDLVDLQLRVAQGEPLPLGQEDVTTTGHAIEARLYAEDPGNHFLPQTGTVLAWHPPTGPGIRVDSGVEAGSVVTADYDPLLAKVVAHGVDRDQARRRLVDALERLVCLGVTTNRAFLGFVLQHPGFAEQTPTTALLERDPFPVTTLDATVHAAIASLVHARRVASGDARSPGLGGWTNAAWLDAPTVLRVDGRDRAFRIRTGRPTRGGVAVEVTLDGTAHTVEVRDDGVVVDDVRWALSLVPAEGAGGWWVHLPHADLLVQDVTHADAAAGRAGGEGVLVAPMHGAVTAVPAEVGKRVERGQPLVILEAMKMEHVVRSDVDGTVAEVVRVGAQVASGDVLARVESS